MKNKNFLLLSLIIISVLFIGCSNMLNNNTCVYICESEHGYIETKLVHEQKKGFEFLIIAHPEDGYYLKKSNLFIFTNDDNTDNDPNFSIKNYSGGNEKEGYRINPSKATDENQYTFRLKRNSNVIISAIFIKQ